MRTHWSRRDFTRVSMSAAAMASIGRLGLSPVSAQEAALESTSVRLRPEIEPLVRLIEDTPREQLLRIMGARVRDGLSYRDVLAGLLLAGVRNVEPRPAVGFKFHAVLVVNSAHLASLASPDADRWLPIFWALDEFKSSQARDVAEGNWTMPIVDEPRVPSAGRARDEFHNAMQAWDESKADVATAGLVRSVGAAEVLELFAQYAARDFRAIGHKVIFLANSWRTLQTIGWQHAEPVLRSLAYAMLNHVGEANPAESDLEPDRPWRQNNQRVGMVRTDWSGGQPDDAATRELLTILRTESASSAADAVVRLLNAGIAPQSVWDALHTASGELLMRQPGIVALHAVTTTNALRYLSDEVATDRTRLMLMLQCASFVVLFRAAMEARGSLGAVTVMDLQAAEPSASQLEQILAEISGQQMKAATGVLGYLEQGHDSGILMAAARRLIFAKGDNAHDYKFSAAVLEDFERISPAWRNRFLATSVFNLRGSGDPDNRLIEQIRGALS